VDDRTGGLCRWRLVVLGTGAIDCRESGGKMRHLKRLGAGILYLMCAFLFIMGFAGIIAGGIWLATAMPWAFWLVAFWLVVAYIFGYVLED
jgi:hypothetical protein